MRSLYLTSLTSVMCDRYAMKWLSMASSERQGMTSEGSETQMRRVGGSPACPRMSSQRTQSRHYCYHCLGKNHVHLCVQTNRNKTTRDHERVHKDPTRSRWVQKAKQFVVPSKASDFLRLPVSFFESLVGSSGKFCFTSLNLQWMNAFSPWQL
jgi:hypothetical protein